MITSIYFNSLVMDSINELGSYRNVGVQFPSTNYLALKNALTDVLGFTSKSDATGMCVNIVILLMRFRADVLDDPYNVHADNVVSFPNLSSVVYDVIDNMENEHINSITCKVIYMMHLLGINTSVVFRIASLAA